jgi:hypothetical protein
MFKKTIRILFLICLTISAITYFTRDRYATVTAICPEVLNAPLQTPPNDRDEIVFSAGSLEYHLTPLYDYAMNLLVLGKRNYRFWGIWQLDKTFPYDLCGIWGENARRGIHTNPDITFSQSDRFCCASWTRDVGLDWSELSNNHLLINNNEADRAMRSVMRGDQVALRGKLVNVAAWSEQGSRDQRPRFTWKTSTTREDRGDGACEVIYVENVEILKRGNPVSYYMHVVCFWGIFVTLALVVGSAFTGRLDRER